MKRLSTELLVSLAFVLLIFTIGKSADLNWPIKENIDLSSGFGDYRQGRFHAGVDIRTNAREGLKIYSPVKGYVYRLKMSYNGYGKGLYIKDNKGNIYVYAHLKDFADKIDKIVKKEQISLKRYYLDKYFPKDSVKIEKNELIGFTGLTGSGQPHLHFEKRSKENLPVNPLDNGFKLKDNFNPLFKNIIFKMTDDYSLFENGLRELSFDVQKEGNKYKLNEFLYFKRPFGILTKVYDKIRQGGMNQSVYKIKLYYDNELYYQIVFDEIDFETQKTINLVYDYPKAVDKIKNVRRLFSKNGNNFKGIKSPNNSDGIFGLNRKEKLGEHKGKIVAEDYNGNKAVLEFDFLWGPQDYIYNLDTLFVVGEKTRFLFTPVNDYEKFSIDSIQLFTNDLNNWFLITNYDMELLENGRFSIIVPTDDPENVLLRLVLHSDNNMIRDNTFNGILNNYKNLQDLSYEIMDDGIIFVLNLSTPYASKCMLEFYYKDSLLGREYPQFINKSNYRLFLPPTAKYAHIDKIGSIMATRPGSGMKYLESLNIHVVGAEDNQTIEVGDDFLLHFNKDTFFEPRYIETEHVKIRTRKKLGLNSNHLKIIPESFATKNDFEISVKLETAKNDNSQSGLCWLDEEENEWVWLDNKFENDILTATSSGGGSFATVFDYKKPLVLLLNIIDQRTYNDPFQKITFLLRDSLSGFEDDRNILVRLDNEWLIPEYEPKTEKFITRPNQPLSVGKHHLGIIITDRAGNLFEQYLNFFYKEKPNKPKGR